MKICKDCEEEKSLDQYYVNRAKKDGLMIRCIDCEKARSKKTGRKTYEVTDTHKICCVCKEDKPAKEFHICTGVKGGLRSACKVCFNSRTPKYAETAKERYADAVPEYSEKACADCGDVKSIGDFYSKQGQKDGLDYYCKKCRMNHSNVDRQIPEELIPKTKTCLWCNQNKSSSDFYKDKRSFDGLNSVCAVCLDTRNQKRFQRIRENGVAPESKQCTGCGETKSAFEFRTSYTANDTLSLYCNDCKSKMDTLTRKRAEGLVREIPAFKICIDCNVEKPPNSFARRQGNRDGLNGVCYECEAARRMAYYYTEEGNAMHKAAQARRRIRIESTEIEPVSYAEVIERDGQVCHICEGNVAMENLTIDHVVPLAKGGAHIFDNLAVAHWFCNSRKNDKLNWRDWSWVQINDF